MVEYINLFCGGNKLESIALARNIVEAIADKKGFDIIVLDIRNVSLLADYFVIASSVTERQAKAILEEVVSTMEEVDSPPLHIEGEPASGWVLVDHGDVIVHLLTPEMRQYYQLEELWSDAKMVVKIQ